MPPDQHGDESRGSARGLPLPAGLDEPGLREDIDSLSGWIGEQDLVGTPAGADLAAVLDWFDPSRADDATVVEAIAAARRLAAWTHHRVALLAAELSRRPSMNPIWSAAAGGPPEQASVAGDEIAMRVACSRRAAQGLVAEGRAYTGPMVVAGDALARGVLDPAKARLLVDRLGSVALQVAVAVQERVLPGAERRTIGQFRRDVERALLIVDPADAVMRRERARTTRRVEHPQLLPDGMACLRAVLPVADAARIDSTLGSAARTARAAGDPRTLDQLRADGLRDLVLHTACTSDGPRSAVVASGPAFEGSDRGAVFAGVAGVAGVAAPPERSASAGDGVGGVELASEVTQPRSGASQDDGPSTCGRRAARAPQIRVTVPLSTLLGSSDHPGELEGVGPIDGDAARALAAGGTWSRLVTDPLSGTVLDVGRTRYRPPPALAEHVRVRDGVCARPGCSTPAAASDLDHTIEFHAPTGPDADPGSAGRHVDDLRGTGRTSADNLAPLCRRCHRLKTDGGFRLRQPRPGVLEWVSPTGLLYRVVPGDDGRSAYLGREDRAAGNRLREVSPPF